MNNVPTKTEVIEQFYQKYFDLVWLARKSPEDFKIPVVKEHLDRITALYPLDVEGLQGDSNWQHGFNSGMLACLRLLQGRKMTADKLEEFPFLDT